LSWRLPFHETRFLLSQFFNFLLDLLHGGKIHIFRGICIDFWHVLSRKIL
jgi:hypothetical protein